MCCAIKVDGVPFSAELQPDVCLLVAARVSLHPQSKYQAALNRKLPIVRPSYLEAMWQAQTEVEMMPHRLPTFAGLQICFEPLHAEAAEQLKGPIEAQGGIIEVFDRAEVVIVKDVFSPLYEQARKIGILTATPAWIQKCLEVRACVQIAGDLAVLGPKPAALDTFKEKNGTAGVEHALVEIGKEIGKRECGTGLIGCILCLLYLQQRPDQDTAKALAWKCGAWTTLNPTNPAITHVLFRVDAACVLNVSVPVEEERVYFMDVSWLEACAQEGRRVSEAAYAKQRVMYNPACDVLGSSRGGNSTSSLSNSNGPTWSSPSISKQVHQPQPPRLAPEATTSAETGTSPSVSSACQPRHQAIRSDPTSSTGVFAGITVGLFGWEAGSVEEQQLVASICEQGGAVVHRSLSPEAIVEARVNVCVCCGFGAPQFYKIGAWQNVALATENWLLACVEDGVRHPRSSFPHFEPGPGPLPLESMAKCAVRITAVGNSKDSHRMRTRLQELTQVLGASVVSHSGRWAEITHVVCAEPELLDEKIRDVAQKRQIPVLTLEWLFDCFKLNARQPEDKYTVSSIRAQIATKAGAVGAQESFAAAVLAAHEVLISPAALGSDERLLQMAEELGATALTWRSAEELQ